MKRLRGGLTYANVISTLALFLVLAGGSAFAAKEALLPKNSVGAKQLKPGSVTPKKLSDSAKVALMGAPGVQGAIGAHGTAGTEGARGPDGSTGAAGTSAASEPPPIDASAPEQPLPPGGSTVALDGTTSWTAASRPGGLLMASLEVTVATNGSELGENCVPTVEIFDNGERVGRVQAGVGGTSGGNPIQTPYRNTIAPVSVNILNSAVTQTITATYNAGLTADCAPGSKIDDLRIIVQPVG